MSRVKGLALAALLAGCSPDMADQPKHEALEPSRLFSDGRSARPPIPGTVARGRLAEEERGYRKAGRFPVAVDPKLLARGKERYEIYCSACHDRTGSGLGMAVRRGFPAPPSFHIDRLRGAPPGHLYEVISDGYGRMYGYADRLAPADRWAVAAYVRALQLSQNARLADVPPGLRRGLEGRP